MAAILSTVDVEDVGTEKIRNYKDALTDLLEVQQRFTQGNSGLAGGAQSAVQAMGSVVTANRAAAQSFSDLAEVQQRVADAAPHVASALAAATPQPIPAAVGQGIIALSEDYTQLAERAAVMAESVKLAGAGLGFLAQQLQANQQVTANQAAAMADLNALAQAGAGFTTEQAQRISELNAKMAEGVPLTQAEVTEIQNLTTAFSHANAETLGLATATQQLVSEHQAASQAASQTAAAFNILTNQLQAGSTVSQLQKDALTELTAAAQTLSGVSDADKEALAALNDQIQAGTQITPELATQLAHVNDALQAATGYTRAQVSALEELTRQEAAEADAVARRLQGSELLTRQLQEGVAVTETQKRAIGELNEAVKTGGGVSDTAARNIDALNNSIEVGTRITSAQRAALATVNQELRNNSAETTDAKTKLEAYSVAAAASAAAFGLIAGEIGGLLDSSARLAARVETLGVVQQIVAKNMHESGTEMQIQTERVRALGITTQEATDSVTQFAQVHLKLADASKLARAAQDLAVIAGENSSQTYARLIRAIETQHVELLRAVGITTTITQITTEYGQSIGKTAKELSTFERQQAVLNYVLERAASATGAYEASMNTAGKQLNSMARLTEEAERVLGKALLPTMSLIVVTLSEMLKWWTALPEPVQAAAAAMLSAAAAMAAFSAAFAAARFVGLVDIVLKLGGAVGNFVLALRAGYPLITAATLAFSGWGLVIAAIIAALGLAVAAWVEWSSSTRQSTEDMQAAVAVAINAKETFAELSDQALKVQASFDSMRARGIAPSTQEQEKYRVIAEKLLAVAPDTVRVLDAQSRSYEILTDRIKEHNKVKGEEVTASLKALNAHRDELKVQADSAAAQLRAAQDEIGRIQRKETPRFDMSATVGEQGPVIDRLKEQQELVEKLTHEVKSLGAEYTVAERAARDAAIRSLPETERQVYAMREANKVLTQWQEELGKGGQKVVTLTERMKILHVTNKQLFDAMAKGPQAMSSFLSDLDGQWQAYEKKRQHEAEQFLKMRENIRESLAKDTPQMRAQRMELDAALSKLDANSDAYIDMVREQSAAILKLGTDASYASGGFTALAKARDLAVQMRDLEAWKKQAAEIVNTTRQLEEASRETIQQSGADAMALNGRMAQQRIDQTRDVNREIEDLDRELYEQQTVGKMKEVDQAVYQEQRRYAQIERTIKDEIRLRDEALTKEREALEERIANQKREIDMLFYRATVQREIQRAELEATRQVAEMRGDDDAIAAAKNALEVFDVATKNLTASLGKLRAERMAAVEDSYADQKATLDRAKSTNDALTKAQLDALERQKDGSAKAQSDIRKQYDLTRQFAVETFKSITQAGLKGFFDIVEGARSWKDVLLDIFRSLVNSVVGLIGKMVESWIDGLVRMKSSSSTTDLLGSLLGGSKVKGGLDFVKQLFGGGAGAYSTAPVGGGGFGPGEVTISSGSTGISGTTGVAAGAGAKSGGMWAGTTAQGVTGAGVAGYLGAAIADKVLAKWINGSGTKGAATGAASGFATGAAAGSILPGIGTLAGGVIGAGVGAIKGWLDAKKMREEMKANRDEIVQNLGGLDAFKKKAEEAGFAYDKFLNTKKPSEFGEEVVKLKAALDALDLKNALDTLPKVFSQVNALRKAAASVGFDLNKLYNAKNVAEFNAEQEKLNKLLEEQKTRLAGLGTAVQGLEARLKGELLTIQRAFKDIFPNQSDFDEFFKKFKEARDKGFAGTAADFAKTGGLEISPQQLAQIQAQVEKSQAAFDKLGRAAQTTFGGILAETGDIVQALDAISPSLDILQGMIDTLGLSAQDAGIANLLLLRRIIQENEDVATSLGGITSMINGLADANRLTQGTFNDLGADAAAQFQLLKDRGVGMDQIMLLMQPTLQALYDAQKRFGFAVDESTQALINQGIEAGVVGDQFQSIQQKTLDILVIIAKVLGADIPAAYDTAAAAAETSGRRSTDAFDRAGQAVDRVVDAAGKRLPGAYAATGQAAATAATDQTKAADDALRALDVQRQETERYRDTWWRTGGVINDVQTSIVSRTPSVVGAIGIQQKAAAGLNEIWDMTGSKVIGYSDRVIMTAGRTRGPLEGLTDTVRAVGRAFDEAGDKAERFGTRAENGATGASEGHSPTGMKQLVFRIREASQLYQTYAQDFTEQSRQIELAAARTSLAINGAPTLAGLARQSAVPGAQTAVTVQLTNTNSYNVNGTKATSREQWEELRGEATRDMENNTNQYAAQIAKAAGRYMRRA